jgi:hypothetical protein
MEVNDRFLTLLTPEGEFLKARNQSRNYQIGQEISFVPVEKESFFNGWSKVFHKKTAGILVVASLLLLFTFLPSRVDNEVYAYMSIDGESSIELAVNKDLEVIDVVAYDESGKEIIANIDWKNTQVEKVSSEILANVDNEDSVSQGIVVGTVYAGTNEKKIDEKLEQVIISLKEETTVEIEDVKATAEERKEAKDKGVSVGKYKAQKAKEKAKEKHTDSLKEEETSVETPVPSVTIPENNSGSTPATNNNGNEHANPNAQKDGSTKQNPGNGNSIKSNPGQQKKELNQTAKQNGNSIQKQEVKNKQVHGNKEEKPRK